jgi:hypothetical protein
MSQFGTLNQDDLKKLGIGLLVAVGGAILTYLESSVPTIDFGAWTPIVVSLNSVIVNIGRKWLTDEQGKFLGKF